MISNRTKIYKSLGILFFLLFPFIYPLGLDGFSISKNLIIGWELVAMFSLIMLCRKGFKFSGYLKCIALYQLLMLAITIIEVGHIGEGLKKLFVFPFACLLVDMWAKKNPKLLLKGLLYILFLEELVTFALWTVPIFGEGHYFVGIRTDLPVIGFLAIFVALICIYLRLKNTQIAAYCTIILVIASIFRSQVSTGIMGLIIFLVLIIFIRFKLLERFVQFCDNKKLIPIGIVMNIAFVFFGVQTRFSYVITQFLGESIYLNGRTVIWEAALAYIAKKPIFGYGVYGVYIPVSWGVSLNYCHTETLQLLLDGGIVLVVAFLLITYQVGKGIDSCEDYFMRKVATICLFCCFIMMITEVFTFYMWFWVLITVMANLKEFEKLVPVDRMENRNARN